MASTYSPDLRIELIATGDQAGVWGSTTNVNLGTLLESAIAGYTSVSVVSAAQAFTANNGVADQARFASIALTATTGAPFSVFAPPSPKLYVIYNASAYAAAIYNSTVVGNTTPAGTGILIPAGKTMAVWSDGTNFAQQSNYFYAPQLSNAVLGTPVSGDFSSGTFTWPTFNQNTSGTAANATNATNAVNLVAANWTIAQSGSTLQLKYNGTVVASFASDGSFTSAQDVTAYGTP
jgi:hypothetical protein